MKVFRCSMRKPKNFPFLHLTWYGFIYFFLFPCHQTVSTPWARGRELTPFCSPAATCPCPCWLRRATEPACWPKPSERWSEWGIVGRCRTASRSCCASAGVPPSPPPEATQSKNEKKTSETFTQRVILTLSEQKEPTRVWCVTLTLHIF